MTAPMVPSPVPMPAIERKPMPHVVPASKLRVGQIVQVERHGVNLRFKVANIYADAVVMVRHDPQCLTVVATRQGDELLMKGERLIVELVATPMDN